MKNEKYLWTCLLILHSFFLNAQGEIFEKINYLNKLPTRVLGYSKIVTNTYEIDYRREANIDTTIINTDGTILGLTLKSKSEDIFGPDTDINLLVSMSSGDTTTTTSTYNNKGNLILQKFDFGIGSPPMFNCTREITYDDEGKVLTLLEKDPYRSEERTIKIVYHIDGLPQSFESISAYGKTIMNRIDEKNTIKYEVTSQLSDKLIEQMNKDDKTDNKKAMALFEITKTKCLYTSKYSTIEDDGKSNLQSITTRDIKGRIYEEIVYSGDFVIKHNQYYYDNGRLRQFTDAQNKKSFTIEYDNNGNPLTEYGPYSKSVMTYNEDGMLSTKATSRIYFDGINELKVIKYYR